MNISVACNMLDFVKCLKIRRTSWKKDSRFIMLTPIDIRVCYGDSNEPYRLTVDDLRATDWINHKELINEEKS